MAKHFQVAIDRSATTSLSEQIRLSIGKAIESGLLAPGARLPSWRDLAAQLGVARGTVRVAYERLTDAQLIEGSRAAGTRVAERPKGPVAKPPAPHLGSFMATYQEMTAGPPAIFQTGIPAWDDLSTKFVDRVRTYSARSAAPATTLYPDPRGECQLRRDIAGYLAVARGVQCSPEQIIVTAGFSGGLGVALRALGLEGKRAWIEDPGFLFTRKGLQFARLETVPVPVDAEGMDVDAGIARAPDAAIAVVTPGQQAPLGITMTRRRRLQLLEWATASNAWIIEDDYLSELQIDGRAAPALASLDDNARVIHIGTFSKTVSPTMRLGFIVVPTALSAAFADVAATLAPAPWPAVQHAMAHFMREGHYLRHLRRLKRLYSSQRDALGTQLLMHGLSWTPAGLALLLPLPDGTPDVHIAREAMAWGMAPSPLSSWFADTARARRGLLLSCATAPIQHLVAPCHRLFDIIQRHGAA